MSDAQEDVRISETAQPISADDLAKIRNKAPSQTLAFVPLEVRDAAVPEEVMRNALMDAVLGRTRVLPRDPYQAEVVKKIWAAVDAAPTQYGFYVPAELT